MAIATGVVRRPAPLNRWVFASVAATAAVAGVRHSWICSSFVMSPRLATGTPREQHTYSQLSAVEPPASRDVNGRQVVAVDTEWVGVGRNTVHGGARKALARVSIVAADGGVLLDTAVQVPETVYDYNLYFTGLTQDILDEGIPYEEAQAWVRHLLHDKIVVGHALAGDWKALDYEHPPELVRDTAKYKPLRVAERKTVMPKLRDLAERVLGRKMPHIVHDSVDDARMALDVYLTVKKDWEATQSPSTVERDAVVAPSPPAGRAPVGASERMQRNVAMMESKPNKAVLEQWSDTIGQEATKSTRGKTPWALKHWDRVRQTLEALPYALKTEEDLYRPELRCVGKPGCKTWQILADAVFAAQLSQA